MAFTEASPAPEQTGEIPPLKLTLQDVPETSPEAFSDTLAANIEAAVKGFTDYLDANRYVAIKKSFMFQSLQYEKDPAAAESDLWAQLSSEVGVFYFTLKNFSLLVVPILKANRNRPIPEQRVAALHLFYYFYSEMLRAKGVLQSLMPFELEEGYEAIHRHIAIPLLGFDPLGANRRVYKPKRRTAEVDPDRDNADQILDQLN